MRNGILILAAMLALCAGADDSNPRQIESLQIGGGDGNTGADLDSSGNGVFNGDLTVDGTMYAVTGLSVTGALSGASAAIGGGYGDTGVLIGTTGTIQANGAITTDGALTADSAAIGGGYGDTGATISDAGVGQFNGALTTDGAITADSATIGGGYGSSGVTISNAGAGQFDGGLTVGAACAFDDSTGYWGVSGDTDILQLAVGQAAFNGPLTCGANSITAAQGVFSNVGPSGDSDLITLAANAVGVNGTLAPTGTVTIGGGYGSTGVTIYDNGRVSADAVIRSAGGLAATGFDAATIPLSTDMAAFTWDSATSTAYILSGQTPDLADWSDAEALIAIADTITLGVSGVTTSVAAYGTFSVIGDQVMTGDLTVDNAIAIDAEAGEDCEITFEDADVTTGMTDLAATDVALNLATIDSSKGGGLIQGLSDDTTSTGLEIGGYMGGGGSTTVPAIAIDYADRSGTGKAALGGTELGIDVTNAGTSVARLYGTGQLQLGGVLGTAAYTQADDLTVCSSSHTGITVATQGTTGATWLAFGDADASYIGGVYYNHTDDTLLLRGAGSTLATLSATTVSLSGDLEVNGNDIDCGDAGGFSGMKFNPASTQLEFWIDGVAVAHIGADGAYSDDV